MSKLHKVEYDFVPDDEIFIIYEVPRELADVPYCIIKVRVLHVNMKVFRAGTEIKYKLRNINTKGAHADIDGLVSKNLFRTKRQAAAHLMKKIERKMEKLNKRHFDESSRLRNIFDKLGSL